LSNFLHRQAICNVTKKTTYHPPNGRGFKILPFAGSSATAALLVTFCVAFHIFVAGNHRQFKFDMQIDHSKSQHTDDKLSLKWAWSCHVIHFKFQGPKHTSVITKAKNDVSPPNGRGYDNVTCSKILPFAVMQRVARVRQRQRSYL